MLDALLAHDTIWFTAPALLGTAVFAIKLLFMLVGAGGDIDIDLDHGDPTDAFKVLSIQSVAAFLMGFGWGGVGALRGLGWEMTPSVVAGVAVGAAMVWLLGLLLKGVYDLQSSGNVPLGAALGAEGDVYAAVPAPGAGRGQVRLVVKGRHRMCNAVSESDAIPTAARIRVVRVNDDNTVTVAPA